MLAVSDDNVLREINTFALGKREDIALRSTRYTTSRTGLYKTWTGGLAWAEAAYHQDLIEPQALTLQALPRLEAGHALPLFGGRLVGRLAGETVDYQREDGYDGLRADLAPELFLPFHLGRALSGSLTGRVRETAYHLTDREQTAVIVPDDVTARHRLRAAPELPLLDENRTRELAEVDGRTGTELARIFSFPHLGLEKLKHTIEPEVRYLFVPQVGRPTEEKRARVNGDNVTLACGGPGEPACNATLFSEGFLFDERDAINRRNFLSYGFTTRLIGRPASPPEAAAQEPEGPGSGAAESRPVDQETLAQGLPAAAVPEFVGPPPPPAAGPPPAPPARELARATILHGYDLSRPLVGDSHQSDVDIGLRLTPVDYLGMAYNTTVSLEESALRGFTVGFFAREPRWVPPTLLRTLQNPTTLGVSYRFIESGVNRSVARDAAEERLLRSTGLEEVDGSLYVRLGNYLGFTFLSRYDLSTSQASGRTLGPHFLERDYLVRLISRCNCWMLEAGLADKFNPNERLFRVQFTLVGLGSFGRRPTTRNYVGFAPLTPLGFQPPIPTRAGGPS
jgi:hypothetical protein